MRLSDTRLQQIRNVLGSCSLEADHTPSLYDELDGHINALHAEVEALRQERDVLKETVAGYDRWLTNGVYSTTKEFQDMIAKLNQLQQAAQEAAKALDRLARLGNGSMLGNSDGNIIAQQALTALEQAGVKP